VTPPVPNGPVAPTPASERTVLALDGGNSKTDVVIVAGTGAVLSRSRSGPFIPHMIGARAAVDSLDEAVHTALDDAGLSTVDHIAGYLANADLPIEESNIRDAIAAKNWSRSTVVENDTVAMLRAGTSAGFGVAVVCGAGINCIGISPSGERVRFPALGRITGDWGGGLGLAKEVLWFTSRAEDGRGVPTALSSAVAAHFGLPSAVAVSQAMHLKHLDYDRMHELVPVLFDTAERGDGIARSIVGRQVDEIVSLVTVALARLELLQTATDVVLGGGILGARDTGFAQAVTARIIEHAPLARPFVPTTTPVVGSALLGLEYLWGEAHAGELAARESALRRVHAELDPRAVTTELAG